MYLNIKALKNIEETRFLLEEFFFSKKKFKPLKLPEDRVKLIAEDTEAKKLIRNREFIKQAKDYLGTEYYRTEEEKEKLLREGIKVYINVKETSDWVKGLFEYTYNFPKDKKEQEKIFKIFFDRFTPFYDYGNGDFLAWDKKQKKLVDITHEENDYKKVVLELNSNKVVKWI